MGTVKPKPDVVWTIAGFDPSSGAGVTADLMSFAAHGLFGCSALTALTVQSTLGATAVHPVAPDMLRDTLEHLLVDLPPAGIKIGMLANPELAVVTANFLRGWREGSIGSTKPPVVLDPVLHSSSGRELYPTAAIEVLHARLLPWVDWITPNWAELAQLTACAVQTLTAAERAARRLQDRHPHLNVVATGGDAMEPVDLYVGVGAEARLFRGEHIETTSTHGTGCAFSSSLLAHLVLGKAADEAVSLAKDYVAGALRAAPGIGRGRGPLGLLWPLKPKSHP